MIDVTPVAPATGTATGIVNFYDGVNSPILLGPGTLTNGVATFATSALSDGVHTITATYTGDTNFASSTSPGLNQTVNINNTITYLMSLLNPSTLNQAVTFTVHAFSSATRVSAPLTGTVVFYDGLNSNGQLGTGSLANGAATFTTSALGAGDHIIRVVPGGRHVQRQHLAGADPDGESFRRQRAGSFPNNESLHPHWANVVEAQRAARHARDLYRHHRSRLGLEPHADRDGPILGGGRRDRSQYSPSKYHNLECDRPCHADDFIAKPGRAPDQSRVPGGHELCRQLRALR
jgi:hypothetical protein